MLDRLRCTKTGTFAVIAVGVVCGATLVAKLLCGELIPPEVLIRNVFQGFEHPPASYSVVPEFRLNDKVDPEEIGWQFNQMKRVGITTVCLWAEKLKQSHGSQIASQLARKQEAMPYSYLSPSYFQMVKQVTQQAERQGIAIWIHDELAAASGTSGNAGGLVPSHPAYRSSVVSKMSYSYEGPRPIELTLRPNQDLLAADAYRMEGSTVDATTIRDLSSFISVDRLKWNVPTGRWHVAVFYRNFKKEFYYSHAPDLLSENAMKEFIDLTHRQYYRQVEVPVGIRIHGTFTDEPHIASFQNYVGNDWRCRYLPWTSELVANFERWKGYDIRDWLPLLYLNGGRRTAKVRCDFWQVVSRMFAENYFGQIAKFDHSVGWKSTGHLNGEESFWWHLVFDGGNEFANQREFDFPGVDWIDPFDYSTDWGVGWLSAFAGKFVSSAAHVYAKKRVMAEVFAGEGYGASFKQMHRMVNWAYVLGVNMLVPQTYKYSLRGADRSTFFTPGISYQQPWWSMSKPFNEYVSRLSYLLSQGEFEGQVAILLPIPDVWAHCQSREYLHDLTQKVHWVTNALLRHNYDFDFVDDNSVQRASVENGRLVIGKNRYRVLILPPEQVASLKTLRRVEGFYRSGGEVIGLDRLPTGSMENGNPDPEVAKAVRAIFSEKPDAGSGRARMVYLDERADTLIQALGRDVKRPMVIEGTSDGVYSMHRKIGSSDVFFLVNSTDGTRAFEVMFRVPGQGEIWDPETGRRGGIPGAEIESGETKARLLLRPYESYFVVFNTGLGPATPRRWWTNPVSDFDLRGEWKFKLKRTMTEAHIGWNFTPTPEGWKLRGGQDYGKIREIRVGNWMERGLPYYSGQAIYEKTFDFGAVDADRRYLLDLGKVGVAAEVWLNGRSVGTRLWRPYTFDITGALRSGPNTLRIQVANTLANYFNQFDQLKNAPLAFGGSQPWMLPSGLMGPVAIRGYRK